MTIGTFPFLATLSLGGNKLSGTIPRNITDLPNLLSVHHRVMIAVDSAGLQFQMCLQDAGPKSQFVYRRHSINNSQAALAMDAGCQLEQAHIAAAASSGQHDRITVRSIASF